MAPKLAPRRAHPRAVQTGIPAERAARDRILRAVRESAARTPLNPPLTFAALEERSAAILRSLGEGPAFRDWTMVLLSNQSWRRTLAAVPYERRLLLLPQCLRHSRDCRGKMDKLGLLCRDCGRCLLTSFKREAEELGYVTLISEGTAAVLALLRSGKISGFVGSSCMSVLRKVFPVVSVVGLPALAVPLLRDGCRDTALDADWLQEAIRLREGAEPAR
jgi:hypothetical protein